MWFQFEIEMGQKINQQCKVFGLACADYVFVREYLLLF